MIKPSLSIYFSIISKNQQQNALYLKFFSQVEYYKNFYPDCNRISMIQTQCYFVRLTKSKDSYNFSSKKLRKFLFFCLIISRKEKISAITNDLQIILFDIFCIIPIKDNNSLEMNHRTVVQYMGIIMSRTKLDVNYVLQMIEQMNTSLQHSRQVIIILNEIFNNEKSEKILLAVQVLEYLIKNCNRNFHHAANNPHFQKTILSLLKSIRGKSSLIKSMTSNKENWRKIQAKILYLIQLWYDAFMLEEQKYPYLIENYKILRKEAITFPPRDTNEKNLLYVATQSPIFDNIETIARSDQQKFAKKLTALGMKDSKIKLQQNIAKIEEKRKSALVNIDEISQKIAIIQSQQHQQIEDVLQIVQSLKKDLQFGKVKPNQQAYWHQIKQAADNLIVEWQAKNSQAIKERQQKYLQSKLNISNHNKSRNEVGHKFQLQKKQAKEEKNYIQEVNLLDL